MRKPLDPRAVRRLLDAARPLAEGPEPAIRDLGKYRILREVGRGAMGTVYEAQDGDLGRRVAIKILQGPASANDSARRRFERESLAIAAVRHANVVTLHDAGIAEDGRPFLILEFLDGLPLDRHVRTRRPSLTERIALVEKIARGVAAAHERGIVHRDLKPSNVLVTPEGHPKVGDFGLAHWMSPDMAMTRTGAQVGTPLYMAPEQIRGEADRISPRTDVFALGAVLYEVLAGRPAFHAPVIADVYAKILNEDPEPLSTLAPGLPAALEAVCLKALAKDPSRRYAHAGDFADDLRRFLDRQTVEARIPPRGKGRALAAAWTLGALTVAAVAMAVLSTSKNPAPTPVSRPSPDPSDHPALRDLEDHFHGRSLGARTDARVREVAESGLAPEWTALARFYASGGGEEPADLGPLRGRALLAAYARDALPAEIVVANQRLEPAPWQEDPEMKRRRNEGLRTAGASSGRLAAGLRATERALAGDASGAAEAWESTRDWPCALIRAAAARWKAGLSFPSPGAEFDRGIADLDRAVELDPSRREAWTMRAALNFTRGRSDPAAVEGPSFNRMASDFEEALRLAPPGDPARPGILQLRAWAYFDLARRAEGRLHDVLPLYDRSIADYDELARLPRGNAGFVFQAGYVRLHRGQWEMRRGRDPRPSLSEAVARFDAFLSVAKDAGAFQCRGNARLEIGRWIARTGGDPSEEFDRAAADYRKAISIEPSIDPHYLSLGTLHLERARWLRARGGDPGAAFDEALKSLGQAVALTPNWLNMEVLAEAYLERAAPGDLEQALSFAGGSAKQTAVAASPYELLGRIHLARGRRAEALEAYKEAFRRNPARPELDAKIRELER